MASSSAQWERREEHGERPRERRVGWKRKRDAEMEDCAYTTFVWGADEKFVLEALQLGAHLQTHSPCQNRVLFGDADCLTKPAANLLRLVWTVRSIEHPTVPQAAAAKTFSRLKNVWSKLQVWRELDGEFATVILLDTDMMPVRSMDDVFTNPAPAAVFRGHRSTLGEKRPPTSYGTMQGAKTKQVGGINGGLILLKPDKVTHAQMLEFLETYSVPSKGAEQDMLTDFFKPDLHDLLELPSAPTGSGGT